MINVMNIPDELVRSMIVDSKTLSVMRETDERQTTVKPVLYASDSRMVEPQGMSGGGIRVERGPVGKRIEQTNVGRNSKKPKSRGGRVLGSRMQLAITSPLLPHLRIEYQTSLGTVLVYDRFVGESYVVYTPSRNAHFAGGHSSGRWYVRGIGNITLEPLSFAFGSRQEAVGAVRRACWRK
jgi:hypothetical protein